MNVVLWPGEIFNCRKKWEFDGGGGGPGEILEFPHLHTKAGKSRDFFPLLLISLHTERLFSVFRVKYFLLQTPPPICEGKN